MKCEIPLVSDEIECYTEHDPLTVSFEEIAGHIIFEGLSQGILNQLYFIRETPFHTIAPKPFFKIDSELYADTKALLSRPDILEQFPFIELGLTQYPTLSRATFKI